MFECPQVYVISLFDSFDRRKNIAELTSKFKIQHTIVDATDARSVSFQEELGAYRCEEYPRGIRSKYDRPITLSEAACNDSHRRCLQALIDSGGLGAVILEDDVVFGDTFRAFLHDLVDHQVELNKSNAVVYCGDTIERRAEKACVTGFRSTRLFTRSGCHVGKVVRFRGHLFGAFAYYVSRQAAISIIRNEPRFGFLSDIWQDRLKSKIINTLYLAAPPPIFLNPAMVSILENDRVAIARLFETPAPQNSYSKLTSLVIWRLKWIKEGMMKTLVDPFVKLIN